MDHQSERWAAEQAILDHVDRFAFHGQQWVSRGPHEVNEACAVYRTHVKRTTVQGAALAPLFEGRTFDFKRTMSEHIAAGQPESVVALVNSAIGTEAAARSNGVRTNGPAWNDNDCRSQDEIEDFLRHAAKRCWTVTFPSR